MNIGDRVKIYRSDLEGTIAGFASVDGALTVLVRLDRGLWTENQQSFITILCVHHSNIIP